MHGHPFVRLSLSVILTLIPLLKPDNRPDKVKISSLDYLCCCFEGISSFTECDLRIQAQIFVFQRCRHLQTCVNHMFFLYWLNLSLRLSQYKSCTSWARLDFREIQHTHRNYPWRIHLQWRICLHQPPLLSANDYFRCGTNYKLSLKQLSAENLAKPWLLCQKFSFLVSMLVLFSVYIGALPNFILKTLALLWQR